jgi:hypothetical protein
MPSGRAYISTISPSWPLDRQREGLKGCEDIYCDDLTKAQQKRRRTDELKDRARMLRPTSRTEPGIVYIAAWICFAWDSDDLLIAAGQAAARRDTIICVSDGTQLDPVPNVEALGKIVAGFRRARVDARTEPGREKGTVVAAARRKEDLARRLALIAEDWPKREHATKDLLARAGTKRGPMAYITASLAFGARPKVQRAYDVKMEKAAQRKALKDGQADD